MDKQNTDIKFEFHSNQEKSPEQPILLTQMPTQEPVPNNNQTNFALLIFLPLALIFFGTGIIGHALCFLNFSFFKLIFFIVAVASICTYGFCAFEIHSQGPVTNKDKLKENKWHLYNQYWLNGLGAFIGWFALYILVFYKIKGFDGFDSWALNLSSLDFIILFIAFLGITGYFPFVALLNNFLKS